MRNNYYLCIRQTKDVRQPWLTRTFNFMRGATHVVIRQMGVVITNP